MSDGHPYTELTPDRILDAVESLDLPCDGRLLALNSYENRVYQIGTDDGFLVAKFYRPERWSDEAIREEQDFVAELAAEEIPVVAPLRLQGRTLHEYAGFRFAVYPRQGGRPPEFDRPETLEWMGRLLGRIHTVGRRRAYEVRPALDIAGFGQQSRDFLLAGGFIPAELEPAWRAIADQALDAAHACFARAGKVGQLRLHGDCHAGNVLWTEAGPHFVDFDDSRMGPAIQDIWMLFSGDAETMGRQRNRFLEGYEQFAEFDDRERLLIEALRTLRLMHYSAWIARRWADPAFPAAFPWFGSQRYWQDRILELREQVALMQEGPA